MFPLALALCGLALPPLATAFSFAFTSTPTQCQNVSVELEGAGTPPYNILIVAAGNPPGGNEIRKIISHDFSDNTTSFQMAWPSNAQFIAMVSDSKGIGTGGTSDPVSVQTSDDSSCLPTHVEPAFFFYIGGLANSQDAITQCTPVELSWSTNATNPVSLYGIIPGGESFNIDTSAAKTQSDGTIGITWTPNVPGFTNLILVAGDASGRASGGSTDVINVANSTNTNCITPDSPTSTAGAPAGQITGAAQPSSSGGSSSSNVGPIVGGVIGGLAFVILVLLGLVFYLLRRRRAQKRHSTYEKPDLADAPPPAGYTAGATDLPHGYEPTPFIIPGTPRTSNDTSVPGVHPSGLNPGMLALAGRRHSAQSGSSDDRTRSSERERKLLNPPAMRPVNFIQHDDAGALPESSTAIDDEPETVELPPTYASVRAATPGLPGGTP